MNQFERIKEMDMDQMASFLSQSMRCAFCIPVHKYDVYCDGRCYTTILRWLKSESKD